MYIYSYTPPPPFPKEKLTSRYHSRDHRVDIQYVMRQLRYYHPDVTSISEFSQPSDGTVTIELSSLKEEEKPEAQRDNIKKAVKWVSAQLDALKRQYGLKE